MHYGTFSDADGAGTGTIKTGLQHVNVLKLTASGGAIVAAAPTVGTTTFPCADPITIYCTASSAGYWIAFGS
jgi:hypothetical protein